MYVYMTVRLRALEPILVRFMANIAPATCCESTLVAELTYKLYGNYTNDVGLLLTYTSQSSLLYRHILPIIQAGFVQPQQPLLAEVCLLLPELHP